MKTKKEKLACGAFSYQTKSADQSADLNIQYLTPECISENVNLLVMNFC